MFTVHLVELEKEKREQCRVCVQNKNTKVHETKEVLLVLCMYTPNFEGTRLWDNHQEILEVYSNTV